MQRALYRIAAPSGRRWASSESVLPASSSAAPTSSSASVASVGTSAPAASSGLARGAASGGSQVSNAAANARAGLGASVVGFLVGLVGAGAVGYYVVQQDFKHLSDSLLTDMQSLQRQVGETREYAERITSLTAELRALKEASATRVQLDRVRGDMVATKEELLRSQLMLDATLQSLQGDVVQMKMGK